MSSLLLFFSLSFILSSQWGFLILDPRLKFPSKREREIKKRMRKTKFYFSERVMFTHKAQWIHPETKFFCLCNNNRWAAGAILLGKVAAQAPLCKM